MHRYLLAILALLLATPAFAFRFEVTESEWAAWPPYCKARYASVRVGKNSEFGRQVTAAEIEQWHAALGEGAWYGLHHHCAGMVYLDRAKIETRADKRAFNLNRALAEHGYMLRNTPTTDPIYAEVLTRVGLVYREKGNVDDADDYFGQAIRNNPANASGYLGRYQLLRSRGDDAGARRVLQSADTATEGKSAEVKYFLGIVSLDLGDKDAAAAYAREAYALGYPLPALRNKLAKAGVELH